MSEWSSRRFAVLAVFATGAAVGMALVPTAAITADGDELATVRDFASALEGRVAALEDLLLTHIGADSQQPPQQGGVVLKAPFNIVDASNRPIFSVVEEAGGATVQVVGSGSGSVIRLEGARDRIALSGEGGNVGLGKGSAGDWGIDIEDGSGQLVANLTNRESTALRIYSNGSPSVQMGTTPGAGGGLLRLFAAGGDKLAVALDSNADGTGLIRVTGKLGEDVGGVWLDGKLEQVMLKGEKGGAVLGSDSGAFGLVLNDSGGSKQLSLNDPGGGMGLRIYERGTEVVGLGNRLGRGGTVNVYSTASPTAGASMFVEPDGSGVVQAAEGDQGVRLDGKKRLVLIESDDGTAELGGGRKGWGLMIGDDSGQSLAELSQTNQSVALRIFNDGANAAQIGTAPGSGGGLVRLFASGDRLAVGLDSNDDGTGKVQIAGKKGEDSGIILDGKEEVVRLDTAQGVSEWGMTPDGWGLVLGDAAGSPTAALTQPDGRGMALRIYEGGEQAAAIGVFPGQGGQLRLLGGGNVGVSAGAAQGNGVVEVFKGGVPTAGMLGEKSQVAVFSESGSPVALLRRSQTGGGGTVEATDSGGGWVFRGGLVPDGPGYACVVNDGVKCLGIGLTGMEGFR